MISIFKNHKVYVPNDTYIIKKFKWWVGFAIDFGPIFLPGIIYISFLFFNFNYNLFITLYFTSLIVAIYWMFIAFAGFYSIKVVTYKFKSQKINKPFKFVFVSDLHIGNERSATNQVKLKKIIKLINKENSEFVLLGGDIIDHKYNNKEIQLLKSINGKKFAVLGNHEQYYLKRGQYTKELPIEFIRDLEKINIPVLLNQGISLSDNVFLGGIKDMYSLDFDIQKSLNGSKNHQFKILMSHNPDIIAFASELEDYDLVLSGHNHGGQIKLGKFSLPTPTLVKNLIHGIYKVSDKTILLLSSGAGSTLRIRFGTKSEILVVKLLPL